MLYAATDAVLNDQPAVNPKSVHTYRGQPLDAMSIDDLQLCTRQLLRLYKDTVSAHLLAAIDRARAGMAAEFRRRQRGEAMFAFMLGALLGAFLVALV